MTEKDLNTRVTIVETDTKNMCRKLDSLINTTNDIYNKIDGLEKIMYDQFTKQKDCCLHNSQECEKKFVTKETNKAAWIVTSFFAVIIVGILSFYGARLYERVDTTVINVSNNQNRIERVETKVDQFDEEAKKFDLDEAWIKTPDGTYHVKKPASKKDKKVGDK